MSQVLARIASSGAQWTRALEPTCGRGNFIRGLLRLPHLPREIQGIEVQEAHAERASALADAETATRLSIIRANVFDLHFGRDLTWTEAGPLLVVGNPPWVTNAELGTLASSNVPRKRNLKALRGIDALTGESNFDIAEAIWLKLLHELAPQEPTIALLCKTSVARQVLSYAYHAALPIAHASLHRIDTAQWFDVAVDACLFCVQMKTGYHDYRAPVYPDLSASEPETIMGVVQGRVVADVDAYDRLAFADGRCPLTWRQGVKHDAASVIELTQDGDGRLVNKRGEVVSIEPNYLYPLLKGSDLQWHPCMPHRTIIVPQRRLGEETAALLQTAPNLWRYLTDRADVFDRRKSAIYRAQPRFAFFGLGDYSFAPYKVAVCGFHKAPLFRAIGPVDGRPVLFDDTCYFVACSSAQQAAFLSGLLNDPLSAKVIGALMFVDAKRPITKKLLQRIDLLAVLGRVEAASLQARATAELLRLDPACEEQDIRWPESLETFLRGETSLANQPGRPTQLTLLDSVT